MAVDSKSEETTQVAEEVPVSQGKSPSEKGGGVGSEGISNGNGEPEKREESKPGTGGDLVKEAKEVEGEVEGIGRGNGEPKPSTGGDLVVEETKMGGKAKGITNGNVEPERKQESKPGTGEVVVVKEKEMEGEAKTGDHGVGEKKREPETGESSSSSTSSMDKSSSFREESNLLSDLKENENKALTDLKSKLEDAVLGNHLFTDKKTESSVEEEKAEKPSQDGEEKGKSEEKEETEEVDKKGKSIVEDEEKQSGPEAIDADIITLWGIPLLPSKSDESIDVILLKFLRAREFKVDESFELLRRTLQWRKENDIDSILGEDFPANLSSVAYMDGVDREGHPVCYNVYGVFENDENFKKTFGNEEQREKFLRWRCQLMEKGIRKLNFKPGGVSSMLQINDLKNTPGPSKKELRLATKQTVGLLQDNYPEFVARNVFINVPFWYYAFYAVLSPFLTQRTKSKFVFARPAKVTETLLRYIAAEQIPLKYGGLKREDDSEFSMEDGVLEAAVKSGSTEVIEIPTPEAGAVTVWDLTVLGWEVNYKEEFVPTDEGSYTVIIQKGKKMGWHEEATRNSFKNGEPGKIVLTIENGSFKKKRALYRYKTKSGSSS